MQALLVVLAALLADNFLLSKLFGVESFFTASEKPSQAALYGGLVTGVTVIGGGLSIALYKLVYLPLNIAYLTTFSTVIIINAVICVIQLFSSRLLKKHINKIEPALPMISGICVVLGAVLIAVHNELNFGLSLLFLLGAGVGFTIVILIFSSVQIKMEKAAPSESFRGIPILLITAALAAMAFSGFYGLKF